MSGPSKYGGVLVGLAIVLVLGIGLTSCEEDTYTDPDQPGIELDIDAPKVKVPKVSTSLKAPAPTAKPVPMVKPAPPKAPAPARPAAPKAGKR